jgi:hypothetical protein
MIELLITTTAGISDPTNLDVQIKDNDLRGGEAWGEGNEECICVEISLGHSEGKRPLKVLGHRWGIVLKWISK